MASTYAIIEGRIQKANEAINTRKILIERKLRASFVFHVKDFDLD
jgi:hypothetical protein